MWLIIQHSPLNLTAQMLRRQAVFPHEFPICRWTVYYSRRRRRARPGDTSPKGLTVHTKVETLTGRSRTVASPAGKTLFLRDQK